jgi:DNA-binding IclR family transcriptional regulator
MHATALGKAVLAYLPELERNDVLDAGLPKLTGRTISTLAALGRELESVRERGYAVEREEAVLGETGIAAPIFGRTGAVVGGIGIAGPSERLSGKSREANVATAVGEAARSISRDLGAQRWPPVSG